MKSFTYTITDPVGIHARPAGNLVKEIENHAANVTICGNGKMADGKKLMQVMTLGIRQDQEMEIRVEGEDEEAAAAAIEQFLKENL